MALFRRSEESTLRPPEGAPVRLWGGKGWCNQQVVGESFRSEAIRRLFPGGTVRGMELTETALLAVESNNAHDPNAVAVFVRGIHVGYLPREDAPRYRPLVADLQGRGLVAATDCRIWGQTFNDHAYDARGREQVVERFSASVTLSLAEPHMCLPVNSAPTAAHVELPTGSAIQIQGEEECMTALSPALRPEGSSCVHVTLHEIEPTTPKGKPVVEVRLDGRRVGQLTPKMSGDLLPAIRLLADRGLVCSAQATVEGNTLKAEVVLFCARAHQLPPDWPGTAVTNSHEPSATPGNPMPVTIPPKPVTVFNVPPGWPPAPEGWEPPEGWRPDPSWPEPPAGWLFWRLDERH